MNYKKIAIRLFGIPTLLASLSCGISKETRRTLEGHEIFRGPLGNYSMLVYTEEIGLDLEKDKELYNRMVVKQGNRIYTLFDLADVKPLSSPNDADLEEIHIADGSGKIDKYKADGPDYEFNDRLLNGSELVNAMNVFDEQERIYNELRPEILRRINQKHRKNTGN